MCRCRRITLLKMIPILMKALNMKIVVERAKIKSCSMKTVFHSRMLLVMRHFISSCTLQVYCDYGGQELAHKIYEAEEDDEYFNVSKICISTMFVYYYIL